METRNDKINILKDEPIKILIVGNTNDKNSYINSCISNENIKKDKLKINNDVYDTNECVVGNKTLISISDTSHQSVSDVDVYYSKKVNAVIFINFSGKQIAEWKKKCKNSSYIEFYYDTGYHANNFNDALKCLQHIEGKFSNKAAVPFQKSLDEKTLLLKQGQKSLTSNFQYLPDDVINKINKLQFDLAKHSVISEIAKKEREKQKKSITDKAKDKVNSILIKKSRP